MTGTTVHVLESLQIYTLSMLLPSFITTYLLPHHTSYKPPQAYGSHASTYPSHT